MSAYKDRYKDADNGLRFQDLVYQGNFKGMEPVPDGILGDKILRQRAKSKVLEKVSKEDVLRAMHAASWFPADPITLPAHVLAAEIAARRAGARC